jgi:Uma2 family endonuclease
MIQPQHNPTFPDALGQPAWGIATLFPNQGVWSVEEYLALETNHLVEFSDGFLEFLEMPKTSHQVIVLYLWEMLAAFARPSNLGLALVAPIKIRLWPGKFREPDVVFMLTQHRSRIGELFWEGADLVMEVVSSDRQLDYEEKRADYAKAGIPEYWIVDPEERKITVLRLEKDQYVVHGEFLTGPQATSVILPGFAVEVNAVFTRD